MANKRKTINIANSAADQQDESNSEAKGIPLLHMKWSQGTIFRI